MSRLLYVLIIVFICGSDFCIAQDLHHQTLLTIDGNAYDAGTFLRVYSKNLDIVQDESQKDLDNYLQLYIDYRLKLLQAHELGLQNNEDYQKELKSYRESLAQSYLTDNEVTDALVKEAYYRMNNEVNASHILIKIDRGASPVDTLQAFNKIQVLRDRVENGDDFDMLARNESEGPSAAASGSLGWFGPFKMVFDFETVAYETPVGEVSPIFRTDFGYHIVKVNAIRKTPQDVVVAHIMTYDQRQDTTVNAQERIAQIYEQLEQGKDFDQMAREFSEDINSANNGGRLPRFGTGGLNSPEFEQAAFEIEKIGDYTKPIKTNFGYHIIKLLERFPLPSFKEAEAGLREQIKKSERSQKITEAFTNKLLDKYAVQLPQIASYKNRFEAVNDSLLTGSWSIDVNAAPPNKLFQIEDRVVNDREFYEYALKKQVKDTRKFSGLEEKLGVYYRDFVNQSLIDYYDEHLERDNDDFAFIYGEYKEGLLLFELMETKIWEAAKTDSLGQLAYYNNHKDDYQWKRRIDIDLTQNTTQEAAVLVKDLLEKGRSIEEIKEELNKEGSTKVMVSSGVVEDNYSRLPSGFTVATGVSPVFNKEGNGFYKVVNVKEILPPTLKTFEEARGAVINDYQQVLEKQWMHSLREGREIVINKEVLNQVKKSIDNKKRA